MEGYVDEDGGCGEGCAVQGCYGGGEVGLLVVCEGEAVVDFVEGHFDLFLGRGVWDCEGIDVEVGVGVVGEVGGLLD